MDYVSEYTVEFSVGSVRQLEANILHSVAGQVAIVTGPGGGLGRWMAAVLGVAGARLFLVDRDRGPLDGVAEVLRDAGCDVETLCQDLTEEGAPQGVADRCRERFGRLDVLVNCAGVNRRMPLLDVDATTYDHISDVNLRIPFFLSQAAARVMAAGNGGAIVNIGSITCGIGVEDSGVYGFTKSAIAHLTKAMAVEWARYGIRINCVAPGFFMTPLGVPIWTDDVRTRWMLDRIPQGRPGRADELSGMVLLLASPAGRYINGQTLYVDGGCMAGSGWESPDLAAQEVLAARAEHAMAENR